MAQSSSGLSTMRSSLAAKYGAEMGRGIVEQKGELRFDWDF